MPWLTDPSITNQMQPAPNPLDAYMRFAQLKNIGQQNQLEQLRLSQLTKQQQDQEQLSGAYRGAFQPGANGVPQLDQGALLRNLVNVNPEAAAQVSAQLNAQAQTQRTQGLEEQTKRIELLGKQADLMTQGAQYALSLPPEQRPKGIQDYLSNLVQQGGINPQQAQQALQGLPLNDPQALETALHGHLMTGLKIKDQLEMQRQQQVDIETERNHRAMEAKQPVTESELALKAAQGDKTSEKALLRLDKSKLASRPVTNIMTSNDAKDIADAIANGDQPPTLQGLYRNAGPVRAELARRGVPLAQMENDWKAVQKHISTLNGPQQTRLSQSISAMPELLDKVDSLYQEWKSVAPTSGFKVLNKASLTAMKQLPGRPGAVANALDAQIADAVGDLATIYMGGNSPTDKGIGLAHQALQSDWNDQSFTEALKQARANVRIRQNSINNTGPAGLSPNSLYGGGQSVNSPGSGLSQPMGGAPVAPGGFNWNQFPEHKVN